MVLSKKIMVSVIWERYQQIYGADYMQYKLQYILTRPASPTE